jgi:carbamoylphosphate synthase large subunit
MMKTILVTGVGGPAGRASARFFNDKGYRVIGTDIVPIAEFGGEFYLLPRGDDPRFAGVLLSVLSEEKVDLLIPTVSEELPAVARMKSKILSQGTQVFISHFSVVDLANDKYLTASCLYQLSLPVPQTVLASDVVNQAEVGELFGYPFIAKPRVGRGGRGVNVIHTAEEARNELRTFVIFQEFMPGEEFDVNIFAYPAGNTRTAAVLRKTSLREGIVGNALGVQRVTEREVAAVAIAAVRKLQLEGPIDMDIRKDGSGRPRILEINARVGANVLSASEVLDEVLIMLHERAESDVHVDGSHP